jgi:hypothetical protein
MFVGIVNVRVYALIMNAVQTPKYTQRADENYKKTWIKGFVMKFKQNI